MNETYQLAWQVSKLEYLGRRTAALLHLHRAKILAKFLAIFFGETWPWFRAKLATVATKLLYPRGISVNVDSNSNVTVIATARMYQPCVLHGESNKGLALPRTTTTVAQTDTPTTQPGSHQTANEPNQKPYTCHLTHHTSAGTPALRTHNAPRASTASRRRPTLIRGHGKISRNSAAARVHTAM